MKVRNVLYELVDQGYGFCISEFSRSLGRGLWGIEIGQAEISVYENGLRYKNGREIEISYSSIVGIKSFMTIELISKAQSESVSDLAMRFECESERYDFFFPISIYSSLLGYFCDRVEAIRHGKIETGFVSE